MPKLICMKGLPASGKSTWAKAYAKTHDQTLRINRDELRLMLKDIKFDPKIEDFVTEAQDALMDAFAAKGWDIIIDNTNLNPKIQTKLERFAELACYDIEWKDFTHVPLSECLERDRKRGAESAGKKVIQRMHRQFLQGPPVKPAFVESAPYAIICDIDGTLAHANGRDIYDASKAGDDELDEVIADIVKRHYALGDYVIFCSGRESRHRGVTFTWLEKHGLLVPNRYQLLMRAEDDTREDGIVKTELYRNFIEGKYNVRYVLDDRDRVVDAWRDLGLKCLQVNFGDF